VTSDETTLVISYNDVIVYNKGEFCFTPEIEEKAGKVLQNKGFKVICDLGVGKSSFTAWGCDLGYEYVKINADYRS